MNTKKINFKNENIFFSNVFLLQNSLSANNFFSFKNLNKITLASKSENLNVFKKNKLIKINKISLKKFLKNRPKVKHKFFYPKQTHRTLYNTFFIKNKYDIPTFSRVTTKFSFKNNQTKVSFSFFKNLFDIIFIKKEKIYTKLKYSRVPQYDIVSGASAALFAGFLGFLICEKFGFELLDSGDFYFLFMYVVFLTFAFKLFTKLLSYQASNWNVLGVKWFVYYYCSLFKFIKIFFNKVLNF